jgi:TonB-dependent starch-binding outer membrane protein SusC
MPAMFLLTGYMCHAQLITARIKNASLQDLRRILEKQARHTILSNRSININGIDLNVREMTVKQILDTFFKNTCYRYEIYGQMVLIIPKEKPVLEPDVIKRVSCKVVDDTGEPIAGATIYINAKVITATDSEGKFVLKNLVKGADIGVTSVGYETMHVKITMQPELVITLGRAIQSLAAASVVPSGHNYLKKNTPGSVTKISNPLFARRPLFNVMEILRQNVPGLLISQINGLPGSAYSMQLRGQNSIGIQPGRLPSDDPFFVIDGIPCMPNSNSLQSLVPGTVQAQQSISPLSLINPDDIESIQVLKDADATAIYGSRGANGVIVINTKKGKPGKPVVDLKCYSGIEKVAYLPELLNTPQYVQMRREALQNDGIIPDDRNASDLIGWDTTRYTDFKKLLIGGTAFVTNGQATVSGGTETIQFLLGIGCHRETTVFPADLSFNRISLHNHLTYQSPKNKFTADIVAMLTASKNNSLIYDLTPSIYLAPNTPDLYDPASRLEWHMNAIPLYNPMALLQLQRTTNIRNKLFNVKVGYKLLPTLQLDVNFGFNHIYSEEMPKVADALQIPIAAPVPTGSYITAQNNYSSWIFEPKVLYSNKVGKSRLTCLIGSTWLRSVSNGENTTAANNFNTNRLSYNYIYGGWFTRLGYQWKDKYAINLTGRAERSNRLTPSKQLGHFGAVGVAWTFSNESFLNKMYPFISFGKIRASYGVIGNDQVGDYPNLNNRPQSINNYQGNIALIPVNSIDQDYSWQLNRKFETAIELGLLNDQLFLTVAWYRHRTGNQVISSRLPSQTGLSIKNSSAAVQNTGWEILLQSKSRTGKVVQWNNNVSLTIPINKLLTFPGLSTSDYASSLVVGQSLSVQQGYRLIGVDPTTGLYAITDLDRDGKISYPNDYTVIGNLDPKLYGGLESSITIKSWQFDVFLEGRVQKAYSYLYQIYANNPPGTAFVNQPVYLFDHWRKAGDLSDIQQFTASTGTLANKSIQYFLNSDGGLVNASYIRLKNVALSYNVSELLLKKLHVKSLRFFLAANNLYTITGYKGADPETRNIYTLPPLKTMAAGFQCSF